MGDKKHLSATGLPPISQAVCYGEMKDVQAAVYAGHDLNEKTSGGWTALHYAVRDNKPDVVSFLLQVGADPTIRNSVGATPRDCVNMLHPDRSIAWILDKAAREAEMARQQKEIIERLNVIEQALEQLKKQADEMTAQKKPTAAKAPEKNSRGPHPRQ